MLGPAVVLGAALVRDVKLGTILMGIGVPFGGVGSVDLMSSFFGAGKDDDCFSLLELFGDFLRLINSSLLAELFGSILSTLSRS